jgi:hypothetical protein
MVKFRATAYRLSRKWSFLHKNCTLAKNVFQVGFKYKTIKLSGSTDSFHTRNGLRQGDSLSYMLFNITLEKVEQKAIPNIGGIILQKSVQILAHADDAVMVQGYENTVKDAFNRLEMEVRKKGFSN